MKTYAIKFTKKDGTVTRISLLQGCGILAALCALWALLLLALGFFWGLIAELFSAGASISSKLAAWIFG